MRKVAVGRQAYVGLLGLAVGSLFTGVVLPLTIDPQQPGEAAAVQDRGASDGEPGGVGGAVDRPAADAAGTPSASGDGGGSGADPAGQGSGATGSGGPGELSASDVGVSAKEITVGVLLFDMSEVVRAGFGVEGADAAQQKQMYEAFIEDVNAAGGVAGRRLKPVYSSYDPLSPDDQLRSCTELTEDAKAFSIFATAGFSGDPVLCVTERHGTILMKDEGDADEYYQRSNGLLFTTGMAAKRSATAMADRAHSQDRLNGKTIGVVMDDRPHSRIPTEEGLMARLTRLGYSVTHKTILSSDLPTAQSQMPVQIAEMRRKGVDLVFLTPSALLAGLWFNQASGQGFTPFYVGSDVASVASDFAVQSAPSSLNAIAYSAVRIGEARAGMPTQAESADCLRRYRNRGGAGVQEGTNAYQAMSTICGSVATFARAAAAAGPNLTRARFAQAMAGLAPFAYPNMGGEVSFANGKPDGADFVRTLKFSGDCKCWVAADQFTRVS